jgi:hypothetical protein
MSLILIAIHYVKTILLTLMTLLFSLPSHAQEGKMISYFESTTDFVNKNISTKKAIGSVKLQTDKLLYIPKLIDPLTGKKDDDAGFPWAISIDSAVLFNFRFATEIQCLEMYVKSDIIGEYCAVFVSTEMLKNLNNYGTNYYGSGLQGVLIRDSAKWGKKWTTESEENILLLVADTQKRPFSSRKGNGNAEWKILSRNNLNDILGLALTNEEIENLSLQNVHNILMDLNKLK